MTAREAIEAAKSAGPSERRRSCELYCVPRGCRREPLDNEPYGHRWSWCPECLTMFDDYGKAVNSIPELQ